MKKIYLNGFSHPLTARELIELDTHFLFLDKTGAAPAHGHEKKEAAHGTATKPKDAAGDKVKTDAADSANMVKKLIPEAASGPGPHTAPEPGEYKPSYRWMEYGDLNEPVPMGGKVLKTTALIGALAAPPAAVVAVGGWLGWKLLRKIPGISWSTRKVEGLVDGAKKLSTNVFNGVINAHKFPLRVLDGWKQNIVRGLSKQVNLKGPDGKENTSLVALIAASLKEITLSPFRALSFTGAWAKKHPWWTTAAVLGAIQASGVVSVPGVAGKLFGELIKGLVGANGAAAPQDAGTFFGFFKNFKW